MASHKWPNQHHTGLLVAQAVGWEAEAAPKGGNEAASLVVKLGDLAVKAEMTAAVVAAAMQEVEEAIWAMEVAKDRPEELNLHIQQRARSFPTRRST